MYHFILTRFNLPLWTSDKNGTLIEPERWLPERLDLFEKFTLPSVIGQTCKDFTWILLCDENTPTQYRDRIKAYQEQCPQIQLIQVEDGYAWQFCQIFSEVVTSMMEENGCDKPELCLTTYLDNDDVLHREYIDTVQKIAKSFAFDSFISFDYGLQYFTELNIATRVKYPNNHFMTLVEVYCPSMRETVATCYGYGSHFLVEKRKRMPVRHIASKDTPMWGEVIHKDNVDNDVKMTFDTSLVGDTDVMKQYGVDVLLNSGNHIAFLKRAIGQIWRRGIGKVNV